MSGTFIRKRWHSARKFYYCDDCGRCIQRDERYLYVVGKTDATQYKFSTLRLCMRCSDC